MWPWGHLASGYLLYAVYTRYRYHEYPSGLAVVALAVGTQLPDLIDKPLAYWWVLPEGRTLAHSALVAVPLCLLVLHAARETRFRRSAVAFAIAYATHLATDSLFDLLQGDFGDLSFLAWPLLAAPDYEAADFEHHLEKLIESVQTINPGTATGEGAYFLAQIALFCVVLLLWASHRMPPVPSLVAALRARTST